MSTTQASKEEVYKAVLNAAIELDIQQGHLKWTYTILARRSKISRSLIYYYFGKEKINILKEACLLFGDEMAGNGEERMQAWKEGKISKGLIKSKELVKEYPYLLPFYFIYRTQENEIGELIRRFESEGEAKREQFFPNLSKQERRIMMSFHMGLVFFPFIDHDDIEVASNIIGQKLFPKA